jgi:hypothetical protein
MLGAKEFGRLMRGASHMRFSPDLIYSPIRRASGRNHTANFNGRT